MNLNTARFAPGIDPWHSFHPVTSFPTSQSFLMHSLLAKRDSKVCRCNLPTFRNFRFDDDGIAVLNSRPIRNLRFTIRARRIAKGSRVSSRENRDRDRLDWIIRQSGWLRGGRLVTRRVMRSASCGRDPPANDKYTSKKKIGRGSAQKGRVSAGFEECSPESSRYLGIARPSCGNRVIPGILLQLHPSVTLARTFFYSFLVASSVSTVSSPFFGNRPEDPTRTKSV